MPSWIFFHQYIFQAFGAFWAWNFLNRNRRILSKYYTYPRADAEFLKRGVWLRSAQKKGSGQRGAALGTMAKRGAQTPGPPPPGINIKHNLVIECAEIECLVCQAEFMEYDTQYMYMYMHLPEPKDSYSDISITVKWLGYLATNKINDYLPMKGHIHLKTMQFPAKWYGLLNFCHFSRIHSWSVLWT